MKRLLLHCIDPESLFCSMALCCARALSCRWIYLQILSKCQNPLETPITLINGAIRFLGTSKTFFRSFQLIFPIDNVVLVHRRAACLLSVSWACISSEEEIKIRTSSVSCSHKTGGQRPHPLAGWCCQDLGRHTRNPAVLGTRLVRVR